MNQEESEHNEVDGMKKGVDSKGEVMHTDIVHQIHLAGFSSRAIEASQT